MSRRVGVGIIGAGTATQAIHLPALATLRDTFEVRHVSGPSADRVRRVANGVGCAWSLGVDQLLSDPTVQVVAVCSPVEMHAEHVVAACRAGKRAVLCEKPLSTSPDEAELVLKVAEETGVPVVVGTMHVFDPAWRAVEDDVAELATTATLVTSTALLPPNLAGIDAATQMYGVQPAPPPMPEAPDPETQARILGALLTGLAGHHVPLLRALGCSEETVISAITLRPVGYAVTLAGPARTVRLTGMMGGRWPASWRLQAFSSRKELVLSFPPSFVPAGSGRATITDAYGEHSWEMSENGYQGEWRHLAGLAAGVDDPHVSLRSAVADLEFGHRIADEARALIVAGS